MEVVTGVEHFTTHRLLQLIESSEVVTFRELHQKLQQIVKQ